jgi:hypothetical protein
MAKGITRGAQLEEIMPSNDFTAIIIYQKGAV